MDTCPFDIHPETGEPMLRLPYPHEQIILTCPRIEYSGAVVEILNDPEVYPFINAPHPHTVENARNYIQQTRRTTEEVWSEIMACGTKSSRVFGNCPVRSIVEIQPNGQWMYIGDFGLGRWRAPGIRDVQKRAQEVEKNSEKPVGDPSIKWSAGYYLKPSHHGRGIVPAVFKTVLDRWAVPHMGVRHLLCDTRVDNKKSQRVFEKMGFVEVGDVPDVLQMPENKGGALLALRCLELRTPIVE